MKMIIIQQHAKCITNQLEFTMIIQNNTIKNILIPDVIIPPGSSVKVKFHYLFWSFNYYQRKNGKRQVYIRRFLSVVFLIAIKFFQLAILLKKQNNNERKDLYKYYDFHSQLDDFITDYTLCKELVYITNFKRGLIFKI
ncbi:unnamed protein product [Paramecium octaurelia]|uniref:Transmembrane protein n=1 Tax=Paramecium octaurelia TaxID=43137 RepID=A0A8S1U1Y7_PAROT|nr:unnamed protein product [Paramecium octaurelia]